MKGGRRDRGVLDPVSIAKALRSYLLMGVLLHVEQLALLAWQDGMFVNTRTVNQQRLLPRMQSTTNLSSVRALISELGSRWGLI